MRNFGTYHFKSEGFDVTIVLEATKSLILSQNIIRQHIR